MQNQNGKRIFHVLLMTMTILCGTLLSFAQTETAKLQGIVTDQSGAVVSGATVTITATGTGRVVTVQTNEDGTYAALALQPGAYGITVTQTNFKTIKQDITLTVAQAGTLDFTLETGAVNETVTVSAGIPLVESTSSAIGNVIDGQQAVDLPLNGRNVLELARLTPGVTQGVVGGFASGAGGDVETARGSNVGGAAISVNGQRTQANNYLLDGVDNNESLVNTINIFPSAEAIQEFRVQTSVATAEFGRGGGGIINSVIKSGTNDVHGSTYLFVRNSALDARPAFYDSVANGQRLPQFRRGQFGATLGGPVTIPHFGEGGSPITTFKNKVFFFFSYDGLRQFLPRSTDTATVPTVAFRSGNFSALTTQLRDPLTGRNICVTGTTTNGVACVNGNGTAYNRLDLLPGNRLNSAALNYLNAFPLPNVANQLLSNYIITRNETDAQNDFTGRIDANLNDKNQMFVRGSYSRFAQVTSSRLPNLPAGFGSGSNPTRNRAVAGGLNTTITPTIFNELRVQYNHLQYGYEPPFTNQAISAGLGIVNANRDATLGGGALIGGYNGQLEYTGDYGAYRVPQTTYQVVDSISYIAGNHIFKAGGTVLRRDVELFRPIAGKGYFRIYGNGDFTQCPGASGASSLAASGTTGFEQADLLIGFACSYQVGTQVGKILTRNYENAAFFQDDWKATSRLTLNLGLRYEYLTNPGEVSGKQANFNLTNGALVLPSDKGSSQVQTDKNNFSPRAGFAYDLRGNGKSVLRGGYGIFYFLDRGGISNQLAQNQPFAGSSSYSYNDGYRITFSGQAPLNSTDNRAATAALPIPTPNTSSAFLSNPIGADVIAIRPDNKISNTQQFNVQYQQQLSGNTALSVGYVATRGRNLILYYNLNREALSADTSIPCPISGRSLGNCYPGIGSVNVRDDIGRSAYDSLQVQLNRRFSRGWQYIAAYTYSKTKDNGEGAFDNTSGGVNYIEPYTTSRSDFPHVLSYETVYELPYGRGRQFGSNLNPIADAFIGGWQVNAIFRAQSGSPFDVRNNNRLVNVTGDPYTGQNGTFLNRAAFSVAANNAVGNLRRNSLRSPSTYQLNLGVTKNFAVYDRTKLQFRADAFNVLNNIQYGTPNTDITNTNTFNGFGTIRGTAPFSNRQLQFGLRLEF